MSVTDQKKFLQELDQIQSDEELAMVYRDHRPWFARPVVWLGACAGGGLILVLLMLFLVAA